MKSILLFACFLCFGYSFGQKKLIASVGHHFLGQAVGIDSTAYTYNSWQGSLTIEEAQPKFELSGGAMVYVHLEPFIHCNQQEYFVGTPLASSSVINNTLMNDKVSESIQNGSAIRKIYEYNAQGLLVKSIKEFDQSGTWIVLDSSRTTYDANGNILSGLNYQPASNQITSGYNWYQSGTNKLTKTEYYFQDSSNPNMLISKTIISYTGNNILFLDRYETDGAGGIVWVSRVNYYYTGNMLNHFLAYNVSNNIIDTNVDAKGYFEFNLQNYPSSYAYISDQDTIIQESWVYDAEGFISEKTIINNDQNGVFEAGLKYFYHYQNTAGADELTEVEVTISPNPTYNFIEIQTSEILKNVEVYNTNGQLLIRQNMAKIDLSSLPSGTYLINGTTENGSFSKKIVKE